MEQNNKIEILRGTAVSLVTALSEMQEENKQVQMQNKLELENRSESADIAN